MKCLEKIFYAASILIFFGCATMKGTAPPPESENLHIVELKKSIAEMNIKLDELHNMFLLLQEKVVANTEKIEKLNMQVSTVLPPEDLKVIKLEEEVTETLPNPEELYSLGQDLFITGEHEKAREAFSSLVDRFPGHGLADNALYWVGESYYSTKDFEQALVKFEQVVYWYPEENKAPDAMLKLGYCYMAKKETEKGVNVLKTLLEHYPESEAANKARKRLREISN
jgi:tol-pal system protein YbgF